MPCQAYSTEDPTNRKIQVKVLLGGQLVGTKSRALSAPTGVIDLPLKMTQDLIVGYDYVIQTLIFTAGEVPRLSSAISQQVMSYTHGTALAQGYDYGESDEVAAAGCKMKCDYMYQCIKADLYGAPPLLPHHP
jgi:hypothetical protein